MRNMQELGQDTITWAADKGIISKDNVSKQYMKFIEEAGELAQAIVKQKDDEVEMELGDVFVTLFILAADLNIAPEEALGKAYDKIAGRTGNVVDGFL